LKNSIVAEVKRIFIVQETIFFMLEEKFEIVETCYHYNFLKSLKNGLTKLYQSDDIDDKFITYAYNITERTCFKNKNNIYNKKI
jgi:hypothetical protein